MSDTTVPTNVTMIAPKTERASGAMTLAERIRAAQRPSVPFLLRHTSDPAIEVRVQRPSLAFLIANGLIPQDCRELVNRLTKESGSKTLTNEEIGKKIMGDDSVDAIGKLADIANATVIAGFIDPRVVLRIEQMTDPKSELLLSDIHPDDRSEYFNWCQGEDAADQAAVKSPAGEESASLVVDDGSEGEAVRVPANGDERDMELAPRADQI